MSKEPVITKERITIGADPELFLFNAAGKPVSGHDAVPGTKASPFKLNKGAVQVDGTSVEFNIDPARTADEFAGNITRVLKTINAMITSTKPGLFLNAVPVATFDREYFDSLPDSCKALGCSPDYDAYTFESKTPIETGEPFRTGAGHVHVGWTKGAEEENIEHFHDCAMLTKQLDAVLYPVSTLWDKDTKRRELYGQVGSFRPKPYGMEYRVLSNSWIAAGPAIWRWIFDATRQASALLLEENHMLYRYADAKKAMQSVLDKKEMQKYLGFLNKVGINTAIISNTYLH